MDEPESENPGQSGQEQSAGVSEKFDQAASRARDALVDAKETVVGTVTNQGEHAIQKAREGAHAVEGRAKDCIYIVALACPVSGFLLGHFVPRSNPKPRFCHPIDWLPWT